MNISISLLTMNVQHLLEVWFHFDDTKVYLASPGNPFAPGWLCAASLFKAAGIRCL